MPASDPPSRAPRVVIVDDAPDHRALLRRSLERGGFEVVAEAGDGQQGLDSARQHHPDLVLLDLAMPVMDGMEALPRLRALCPDATIVVLSGLGAAQTTRRAMAAGADGYLQKGQPMSAVLAYVHDLLDGTAPRPAPPRTHDATPHEDPTRDAPPAPGAEPVPALPALTAAVQDATYGVLEVLDEPIFRVVWGNKAAEQLLGRPCRPGTPLFAMASALAGHLAQHRGHDDSLDSAPLAAGPVPAVLRRAGGSLLLFLGAAPDDLEGLPL